MNIEELEDILNAKPEAQAVTKPVIKELPKRTPNPEHWEIFWPHFQSLQFEFSAFAQYRIGRYYANLGQSFAERALALTMKLCRDNHLKYDILPHTDFFGCVFAVKILETGIKYYFYFDDSARVISSFEDVP